MNTMVTRIAITGRTVYDGPEDTEAGVVSMWTADGPVVIQLDSVAAGARLLEELILTMQRLNIAGKHS